MPALRLLPCALTCCPCRPALPARWQPLTCCQILDRSGHRLRPAPPEPAERPVQVSQKPSRLPRALAVRSIGVDPGPSPARAAWDRIYRYSTWSSSNHHSSFVRPGASNNATLQGTLSPKTAFAWSPQEGTRRLFPGFWAAQIASAEVALPMQLALPEQAGPR